MPPYCQSMTEWNECLHPWGPEPCAPWLFGTLEIQIESSMSQPIRSESDDLMSGCVPYLVLGINIPVHPVLVLLLINLLGYKGPTIVKPVLCLELGPWARALGWLQTVTTLSGGGAPSCSASIKS